MVTLSYDWPPAEPYLSDVTATLPSMSQRARITQIAAGWLNAHKQPGEELGLGVEQQRDGWRLVIRSGDVGVTAHCGPDPDDATIAAVLIGLLADARKQAAIGAKVKAERFGSA